MDSSKIFDVKSWTGFATTAVTGLVGSNQKALLFLKINFRLPTITELQYGCLCVSFLVGVVTFGYTVHKWLLIKKLKQ
jgi:hypothetical protein